MNDLQPGDGVNHGSFSPSPSVGENENGVMVMEITYTKNGIPGNFNSESIFFTDGPDLEGGVSAALAFYLGGSWSVSTSTVGSLVRVTSVSSVNANYECTNLAFIANGGAGDASDHSFSTSGYEDPFIAAAASAVSSAYAAASSTSCNWSVEVPLVAGSKTGSLEYSLTVQSNLLQGSVEVYNEEDTLIASATFVKLATGPHDCGVTHSLTKFSAWSARGPSDGLGPLPAEIADWDGATQFDMNH